MYEAGSRASNSQETDPEILKQQALEQLKRVEKIGFVDTSDLAENRARDIAHARMMESKDKLRWYNLWSKFWKHNAAQEYYREKEIIKARQELQSSGNQFLDVKNAGVEENQQAMGAVVDRFVSDYEEAVRRDAGEEKRLLNNPQINRVINDLIKDFAFGNINGAQFDQLRIERLQEIPGVPPELLSSGIEHAGNLFEVAKNAREAVRHGASVEELDLNFKVIAGKAKDNLRAEGDFNSLDKTIDRIKKTSLGRFVDENTLGLATAAAYAATLGLSSKLIRSKAVAWLTLGAGAVVGGGVAAIKENKRIKEQRGVMMREQAVGKTNVRGENDAEPTNWIGKKLAKFKKSKLGGYLAPADRKDIGQSLYETKSVGSLVGALERSGLAVSQNEQGGKNFEIKDNLTQEEFDGLVSSIAEIEARLSLEIQKKGTLIEYSKITNKDQEYTDLEIYKAAAKAKLAKMIQANPDLYSLPQGTKDLQSYINQVKDLKSAEISGEVSAKDEAFKTMKNKKVAGRFVTTAVMAVAAGMTVQQLIAWGGDAYHSFTGTPNFRNDTIPEYLLNKTTGKGEFIGNKVEMINVGDTQSLVDQEGHVLIEGIQSNPDGTLTRESLAALESKGYHVFDDPSKIETVTKPVSASEYWSDKMEHHPRGGWHDERGKSFSSFFNKMIEYEGKQQMLYLAKDADGKVYVDVNKIVDNFGKNLEGKFSEFGTNPDGSVDTQMKQFMEQMQEWKKEGTLAQHLRVRIIPTDEANSAGLSYVTGGADSANRIYLDQAGNNDLSKLFNGEQSLKYGHHPFRFMELSFVDDEGKDNILATTVGGNAPDMNVDSYIHHPDIYGPEDYDVPVAIPFSQRRPLTPTNHPEFIKKINRSGGWKEADSLRWKRDRSPRLENDPGAMLNQSEEINWYLQQQLNNDRGAEYTDELRGFVENNEILKQLPVETRMIVCMPVKGDTEMENIYGTLELYSKQPQDALDQTVILMNVNWPNDADSAKVQRTLKEIERAKRDFPNLKIAHFTKVWDRQWMASKDNKIYGTVVKYLNDTALKAIQNSGIKKDVYLITNDADARGMSKEYLKNYLQEANKNPNTDAFTGKLEWGSEIFEDFPGFHVSMRMMQYLDAQYRHGTDHTIPSYGGNFMVKASTFAAVGGYNSEMGVGVDGELGKRLMAARKRNGYPTSPQEPIKYAGSAWLDTDPSRALQKYVSGEAIGTMWNDFDQDGYTPRGDLAIGKKENLEKDFDDIVSRIEFQLTFFAKNWEEFKGEFYKEALNNLLPPRNGKVAWEVVDKSDGDKQIKLTEVGKNWLKNQLINYKLEKRKNILYQKRGFRRAENSAGLEVKTEEKDKKRKLNVLLNYFTEAGTNEMGDKWKTVLGSFTEEQAKIILERSEKFKIDSVVTKKLKGNVNFAKQLLEFVLNMDQSAFEKMDEVLILNPRKKQIKVQNGVVLLSTENKKIWSDKFQGFKRISSKKKPV